MRKIKFVLICFFLFSANGYLKAQKQYSFNNPNNVCYFQYICYAADNDYREIGKPLIFVIGKPGETAQEAYENDTIKNIPQFFSYIFVYIPNRGETPREKLYCVPALAGLLSYNAYVNLFCFIKDESITSADVKSNYLGQYFKSVKLTQKPKSDSIPVIKDSTSITNSKDLVGDFKSEAIVIKGSRPKPIPYKGPATAFKFTISGRLVDANTFEALPFATIMLKGKPVGTTTNADGLFTLVNFPTDTSTVVVSYLGYKRTEFQLTPVINKSNVVIEMEQSNQLNEVTVVAEKEELMNAGSENLGVIKMSPAKLNQLPNIGEKDIMRSFQLMPGVSASNESSSGLYVRGGSPDQNLVLYDGFTVYQVDHLYGFYSAFNANALKDVQLFKGGFESKFGGRISSVVEITGKDGNQKNYNFGGDISFLSFNLFVETPIGKKLTFLGAFRRSFQGPIYNLIFKQFNNQGNAQQTGRNSFASTVSSYFYDLNSKLTYRPNNKDIISLSVYNGTDKLDNSRSFTSSTGLFSAQIIDLTKYGNLGGSAKWSRKWSDKIYGNTLVSFSNFYSTRELSNAFSAISTTGATETRKFGTFENNNLKDYSFKSDYTFDLFANNQIGAGVSASYYDILYDYSQNDTSTILNRHNFGVLGCAYLQDKIKFADGKLVFLPGIRASYFSPTASTQPYYYEPRMAATYNITRHISLKASTGRFYQFVNQVTREDILNGNKTFWVLSDGNNVPVSQAIHYMGGLSYDIKGYLFSVEGWYKQLSGLTQHTLRFNTSSTEANYSENFYKGSGYSQGIEYLVQKKMGDFSGWVSYTMSQTRSLFQIYQPSYYAADQDVPNEFKIIGIYKWKKFSFTATWIYASGRPYTAPSGAYNVTLLDGTTQSFYTVSSKNSLRLPDYHRLDLAATYQFKNNEGREFGSIGVSIFNVYDRQNVWYKQFQIVGTQIIESNVLFLGIVPNLTLSLKLR